MAKTVFDFVIDTTLLHKVGLQPWTAVHDCDPTLSISVVLVSRKVNFLT